MVTHREMWSKLTIVFLSKTKQTKTEWHIKYRCLLRLSAGSDPLVGLSFHKIGPAYTGPITFDNVMG
jgi:hypothetical protein